MTTYQAGGRAARARLAGGAAHPARGPRVAGRVSTPTASTGTRSPGWCSAAAPRGWPCASSCDERTREAARTGRSAWLPGTDNLAPDRRRRRLTAKFTRPLGSAVCRAPDQRAGARGRRLAQPPHGPGPAGTPVKAPNPKGDGRYGNYQEGRQHHDAHRREQPHQARAAGEGRTGPGECRGRSPATFASASARTAWACAAFSSALSAFARARSAFPGGSRRCDCSRR